MLKRIFAIILVFITLISACAFRISAEVTEYPFDICCDEETSHIYNKNGTGFLFGFDYDFDDGFWYSPVNAWQRNFGYSKVYDDLAFVIGCYYDTVRVYFEYEGKEWLVQYWKGIYGFTSGAEIGVYNRPSGTHGSFYRCIKDEEMPKMKLIAKRGNEVFVSQPSQEHWWLNGFVMMSRVSSKELRCEMMIDFGDRKLSALLSNGLRKIEYNDNKTVKTNGTAVTFFWQ